MPVNRDRLLETFCALVRIDNPSGQEAAMAAHLIQRCEALGMACSQDAAGNVLARLEGRGEPLLFAAHMDSVAVAVGKEPVVRDGVVYSAGDTVLGADDLAGVTAILEGIEAAREGGDGVRGAEVLFTVQEEVGLKGARAFDYAQLRSKLGIAFDLNGPVGNICIGSPAHDTFTVTIHGKSAHAGVAPETGVSAIKVAAAAIAAMPIGRIDEETTSNIGTIEGGSANNIVPERARFKGEIRSRNQAKLAALWEQIRQAIESAAAAHGASAEIQYEQHYGPSVLDPESAIVRLAIAAVAAVGLTPELVVTGGGSDVSIIAQHGIETANLSMGYQQIHSSDEHIEISEIERAAAIVAHLLAAN
ncbi:MAG TPA: M20/M25/M40 family metallo-hydrolase [Herpetosiphonaceae bacterium]